MIMHRIIDFLKSWLLPTAMITGTLIYLVFAFVPALSGAKPFFLGVAQILMPTAIFLMLFFTFCKINIRDMKPRLWHLEMLALQVVLTLGWMAVIYYFMKPASYAELVGEGVLACLMSPTAAAAAVVTGKLGGSAASLTSYTLESNIVSALLVTFVCPIIHPIAGLNLLAAFLRVLVRVSFLLVLPFILAMALKYVMPKVHARLAALKDVAFYIWGCSLTMVTGMTMRVVFAYLGHPWLVFSLVVAALLICVMKFGLGKAIGSRTGKVDKISAGQAFGQKNTMFTIWMALSWLSPVAAVAPGSYVIWQNIINSYQLWKMGKKN